MRVYARDVANPGKATRESAAVDTATPIGRRRSASGVAQEKRKAWGREWGATGAAYKRKRLESER